ncbi:MAG TPA: T9SS type A sorting domain-containing protein [Chitinophagales bacterium]|nr:T9SS type A sorting domain-containing protein [Chitinophagales bacterium]
MFNKYYKPDSINILSPACLPLNNGYLFAGSFGSYNTLKHGFYIRKTDLQGETEWFKTFEYGNHTIYAIGGGILIPAHMGTYMLVGSRTYEGSANQDIVMINFLEDGTHLWTKLIEKPDTVEYPYHITPTQDGGYIMCGIQRGFTTSNRFYVLKTDAFGNKEWDSTYSSGAKGLAYSIAEVLGGYLVSGYRVQANNQMYLIKIDNQGLLQWEITYGDNTQHNTGCVVEKLDSTHYLVVGGVREDNILKMLIGVGDINQNGILLWSKVLNISNWVDSRLVILGNGFLLSTISKSIYNYDMPVIMRFTSTGDTLWTRTIPGTVLNNNTYLKDIAPAADGGYIFSGFNYSTQSSWVVKTDSLGYTCSYLGCDSIVVVEVLPGIPTTNTGQAAAVALVYPIPATSHLNIRYQIPATVGLSAGGAVWRLYNAFGSQVAAETLQGSTGVQQISVTHLPPGMYFYRVTTPQGQHLASGKLVVQ